MSACPRPTLRARNMEYCSYAILGHILHPEFQGPVLFTVHGDISRCLMYDNYSTGYSCMSTHRRTSTRAWTRNRPPLLARIVSLLALSAVDTFAAPPVVFC